jgi:hypothetical protein
MSLSDLASFGSLISGVAVLISLVYLSLQVKQTEKNQRALMNQGYITRTADILMHYSHSVVNAERARVISGDTKFTAEELNRLSLTLRIALLNLQDARTQHKSGLIDRITLDNDIGAIKSFFLNQPVFRAIWPGARATYAPELTAFIDDLIAEVTFAQPADVVETFQRNLAVVTG